MRSIAFYNQIDHLTLHKHSGSLTGNPAGRPGPLEVIAAEPAGDIHHLADEKEAADGFGFHGLGIELTRIDPSKRNFCGTVTFRARRLDARVVYRCLDATEHLVGHIRQMTRGADILG